MDDARCNLPRNRRCNTNYFPKRIRSSRQWRVKIPRRVTTLLLLEWRASSFYSFLACVMSVPVVFLVLLSKSLIVYSHRKKLAPGHSAHNQWGLAKRTNKTRQLGPTGYELSNARAGRAGPLLSFVSVCAWNQCAHNQWGQFRRGANFFQKGQATSSRLGKQERIDLAMYGIIKSKSNKQRIKNIISTHNTWIWKWRFLPQFRP